MKGEARYWQTYYVQTDTANPIFTGYVPLGVTIPKDSIKVIRQNGEPARFQFPANLPYKALSQIPDFVSSELRRDVNSIYTACM